MAARLDAAREGDRGDGQRLSDELQRAADLRTRLAEVERSLERLSAEGQRRADAGRRDGTDARGKQRAQAARPPRGRQAADTAEDVAQLQRQLAEQLRETRERVEALSRDNPEMRGPATPEEWQPSVSAPGTEAFKQDFARWESLKKNLLLALERVERSATTQLREQRNARAAERRRLRRRARRLPRPGAEVLPVTRRAQAPGQIADAVRRSAAGLGLRARVRGEPGPGWYTYAGAASRRGRGGC